MSGVRLVDGQAPSRDGGLIGDRRSPKESRLPNGLRVLTKEVRSAPVVSFGIWYQVGSRNEHNGITGISHLLEHMMFKGTQRYRLGEIARTLFLNGASFNANTFYDWTSYFETLARDRLELAIELEADRIVQQPDRQGRPRLGDDRGAERTWRAARTTPETAAAAGGDGVPHSRLIPISGRSSAGGATSSRPRDALRRYYRRRTTGPNTATVVIVGDFETERPSTGPATLRPLQSIPAPRAGLHDGAPSAR